MKNEKNIRLHLDIRLCFQSLQIGDFYKQIHMEGKVTLTVLEVYDTKDPQWNFLIKNKPNAPPSKVVEISEMSIQWVNQNIPHKILKNRPRHIIVECPSQVKIPLGNTTFDLYTNKNIVNITYTPPRSDDVQASSHRGSATSEGTQTDSSRWEELNFLMAQRSVIDDRIKDILLQLQSKK
jgi:hypothetical protein